MSRIIQNTKRLFTTPGMLHAYYYWLVSRKLLGKDPTVACTLDTQVDGWINFSEYWSFHQGIPEAEKALMQRCLLSNLHAQNSQTIAVDIGANIGLFTLALASIGYSKVHAFEPIPQTFSRLNVNLENSKFTKKVKLNCVAVGGEEGFVEFQIFDNSPATNRLLHLDQHPSKKITTQRIPVTSLDKYCSDHKINKIDFLKIDVEGMEPLVIQGASQILKSKLVKNILLEICPNNLSITGNSLQNLYESIVNVGYIPHTLLLNGDVGSELNIEDLQKITLANIVLIPTIS